MSKITLTDLVNLENQTSAVNAINSNNAVLETAFDNTLSRDGTSPNQMAADLDMNSNRILNLPNPVSAQEPVTYQQLSTLAGGGTVSNIPAGGTTGQTLQKKSNANYDTQWSNSGSGTVTSVGVTGSADFTVTGSPITNSGVINIAHASTTGTGSMVRATNPTISGPTVDQLNVPAGRLSILNGANAQGANVGSLLVASTYGGTPPTNGISTQGGVAFVGATSGTTQVNASSAASGTLTLPAATGNIVADSATQTLTNKTINGANNTMTVRLANDVTGNLPVTNLNSGTGASSSTFWRGDGTWVTPAGSGTVTSVSGNGVTITGSGTIPSDYGLNNHGMSISASAGALTINLTDATGATPSATSPVFGQFYNVAVTNGTWSSLAVTSALSLTVPSSATLGVASSSAFRLWVVLFNDAGTPRLGVINTRSGAASAAQTIYPLIESQVASSIAISSSSNAGGTFYTGTAVSSKTFLIVGYLEWNSSGVTAGTWTTTNQTYIRSFAPGVRKPGEPVGNLQSIVMGSGSSGATTMADVTGATLTMTPSSPANIFRAQATASCTVTAGGAATNSTYTGQLLRGATVISNFSMGVVSGGGTNQQSQGSAAWHAIDFPNTSSNSTYKLQHSATGGSSTAQTFNVCMTVEEIMT